MFSDMFVKLWQQNLFLLGVWQTIYLTVISTVFAYVLGLPLGLLLCVSDKDGIHPMPVLNKILSILINAFRSVPFIILMVAMLPVAMAAMRSDIEAPFRGCRFAAWESMVIPCGIES